MSTQEDERNDTSSARSYLDTIVEWYNMNTLLEDGEVEKVEVEKGYALDEDDFREYIQRDILDMKIRDSAWWTPGDKPDPDEYRILLATGGPAVQVTGTLGGFGEPANAEIQQQDWFSPWITLYPTTEDEDEALLWYAQTFYWGCE